LQSGVKQSDEWNRPLNLEPLMKTAATKMKKATAKSTQKKSARKTPVAPANKKETVIAMLREGATIEQMSRQTGWQKHTVRGFLAGSLKKAGFAIDSFKPDGGERTYRIAK
jgi:hypothetical protein